MLVNARPTIDKPMDPEDDLFIKAKSGMILGSFVVSSSQSIHCLKDFIVECIQVKALNKHMEHFLPILFPKKEEKELCSESEMQEK